MVYTVSMSMWGCLNEGSKSMRQIVLKVEERLLRAANQRAASEQTTLNDQFCLWLEEDTKDVEVQYDPDEGKKQAERAMKVIDAIRKEISTSGHKFDASKLTREEMNERR